jgi:general stress protein YciG
MADSNDSRKGFASFSEEKRREVSAKGGKAAHALGRAHEFTADEARDAGRKGGATTAKNREHMSEIGKKGGKAAHALGRAHKFTSDEARAAGRKGGAATANKSKGE